MVQEWFDRGVWEQYWPNLGVTAENGCFYRWGKSHWESLVQEVDLTWMAKAHKVMRTYTDRVHGTYIQEKSCSIVWHYADCDQDWGAMQARELTDHLEDLLENHEVDVIAGQCRVEVRPKSINKVPVRFNMYVVMYVYTHVYVFMKSISKVPTYVRFLSLPSSVLITVPHANFPCIFLFCVLIMHTSAAHVRSRMLATYITCAHKPI